MNIVETGIVQRKLMTRKLYILLMCGLCGVMSLSCGEEISADLNVNDGYRVFGLRVEPPIARPDDTVVITAYDHHPKLDNLAYSWSLCLYSHGSASHFECLSDRLLLPLQDFNPRIILDFSKNGIDLRTRLKALGQYLDINGKRRSLEDGLDLFIILKSGDPREGLIRSVKRIRVIDQPGTEPLATNPLLKTWTTSERGVTNRLPSCEMTIDGPESSIEYNDLGEIVNGTLRESVLNEIEGTLVEEVADSETENECILHANALIDVKVNVSGTYESTWSTIEGYTYRWYITADQKVLTPISVGGIGYGQFEVSDQNRKVELMFSVRDAQGGFSMGRQLVNLVPGISTRN